MMDENDRSHEDHRSRGTSTARAALRQTAPWRWTARLLFRDSSHRRRPAAQAAFCPAPSSGAPAQALPPLQTLETR